MYPSHGLYVARTRRRRAHTDKPYKHTQAQTRQIKARKKAQKRQIKARKNAQNMINKD